MRLQSNRRVGPYRLIRLLGSGAMADVWLAENHGLVALKVLRGDLLHEPSFVARFEREARRAAMLAHPNIVRILGPLQRSDGHLYLPMQFVPGSTLRESVAARGRLPWPFACRIAAHVCRALEHAHTRGIIHRDVKPANILVTPQGHASLTDFGILRAAESSQILTRAHEILGTPYYIAPEQALGRPVSATDVYAMGVVLFEMTTGRVPFAGRSDFDILEAHLRCRPPAPKRLNPVLPRALSDLVLRALEKDPVRRPTARQVAAQLESLCQAAPTRGPGPNVHPLRRGPASAHDRRAVLVAVLLADVAALIGAMIWLTQSLR